MFVLTLAIFFAELIGGFLSNSLALLSDAGHLFADVFALGLSLVALYLSRRPATKKRTFGYYRAEVFAAIINGISLVAIAGVIFIEAYRRLLDPEPVKTLAMLTVAVIGLAVNVIIALSLHRSAAGNLNVKSAYLHVIGDMLASVGVIAGGLIMLFTGNYIADPVISIIVGLIILRGAYGVIREGASILFESVPYGIDYDGLKKDILATSGVLEIHDLHVWTLSSSNIMLTVHVHVGSTESHVGNEILRTLRKLLKEKYNINHTTIQLECDCCETPSESVCVISQSDNDSKIIST
ncbi:MAG: cation transporter [candidate division Zixibacteria bacterium]|nr:cation transporter [candidate division Zixibacteria bacterium]